MRQHDDDDIPDVIWLQIYGDGGPDAGVGTPDWSKVTWCREDVWPTDVPYRRIDIHPAPPFIITLALSILFAAAALFMAALVFLAALSILKTAITLFTA